MTGRRIAIVHDWLVTYGGAERVLKELVTLFPQADLFSVVDFLPEADRVNLLGKRATTTFIQRLPLAARKYRSYLPLMPLAIEQLDLSGYDLVLSSSHAVAKGVITGPGQVHVCYCHTPIRYAWDLQHQYLREAKLTKGAKSALARLTLHYIRHWDLRSVPSVDRFIANSHYIAERIRKLYGREALVIHPPAELERFELRQEKEDFYLAASRLVPYKRMELIAAAFARMPDRKLVIIGDGPCMDRLRKLSAPNVSILGHQPFSVLHDHMRRARGFVFAAEEDFGIIPVEAQACGTPVIAFGRGGATETVIGDPSSAAPTGLFFHEQTEEALITAIHAFEKLRINPMDCRRQAENFTQRRFQEAMQAVLPEFIDLPAAADNFQESPLKMAAE